MHGGPDHVFRSEVHRPGRAPAGRHSGSGRDTQSQHPECGQRVLTNRGRRKPRIARRGNGCKRDDTGRQQTREPQRQAVAAQHPAPQPTCQAGDQRSDPRRRSSSRTNEREAGSGRDDRAGSIPDPAGARRCRSGIRPPASARRSGPAPRSRRPLPRARTTVRRHAAANEEAPGQSACSDSRLTLYEHPERRRRIQEFFRNSSERGTRAVATLGSVSSLLHQQLGTAWFPHAGAPVVN